MGRRIKSNLHKLIKSRAEAEQTLGRIRTAQNDLNALRVERDERVAKIDIEYEGRMDALSRVIDNDTLALEAWAGDNRDEFPSGRKSIEFVHGTIGFRTGTPKVKKGRKYRTLQLVAQAMKQLSWARKYVKQAAPTVNKELIIADRGTLTAEQLNMLGLSVVQDETFFVEPKSEPLEQGARVA